VIELADPANARLSFSNLTEAHVLDALRRQYQVELPQIRRVVSYLREHFRSPHPLVHHDMLTGGKHLFVEAAGLSDVINASRHGQLAMRDLIGLHLKRVEWDKDGFVARLCPLTRSRRSAAEEASQPRVVTMDPRVEFGRPILKLSAVPTAVIADRYKAGESIADLAEDYGETRSTSKKRSAASSSRRKPSEPLVFFVDRSWAGRRCPRPFVPPVSISAQLLK
jgi:uncharacterized protein (DUF433 family)